MGSASSHRWDRVTSQTVKDDIIAMLGISTMNVCIVVCFPSSGWQGRLFLYRRDRGGQDHDEEQSKITLSCLIYPSTLVTAKCLPFKALDVKQTHLPVGNIAYREFEHWIHTLTSSQKKKVLPFHSNSGNRVFFVFLFFYNIWAAKCFSPRGMLLWVVPNL